MFLFAFCFHIKQKVSYKSTTVVVKKWGFHSGGAADVKLTEVSEANYVLFSLCNELQYRNYTQSDAFATSCIALQGICESSRLVPVESGIARYNGTAKERDYYRMVLTACQTQQSSYQLDLTFRNPKSLLSFDLIPCLVEKPIFVTVFCVGILFWFVNWAMNCGGSHPLHVFFTCAVSIALLYIVTDMAYYVHYDKSDSEVGLATVDIVFGFMFQFMFISGIILISRGFGIIHNDYTTWQILITCGITALVIASMTAIQYIEAFWWQAAIFLVFMIALFFLMRLMISGVRDALLHIIAHMVVIAEAGFNPATTPINDKLKLYNVINYIIICYFVVRIIIPLLGSILYIPVWVSEMIFDIINSLLLYGTIYLFRLRSRTSKGYAVIGGSEAEIQEFTKEDIEKMNINDILAKADKEWDGETPLPPQPRIVEVPTLPTSGDDFAEPAPDISVPPIRAKPNDEEIESALNP